MQLVADVARTLPRGSQVPLRGQVVGAGGIMGGEMADPAVVGVAVAMLLTSGVQGIALWTFPDHLLRLITVKLGGEPDVNLALLRYLLRAAPDPRGFGLVERTQAAMDAAYRRWVSGWGLVPT